ncbi:MAG TPA: hypothetical protein PKC19_02555 [Roseiflexaceae bacterium]|nr:hypothetical protein [Roseiflexaceae bacterium]
MRHGLDGFLALTRDQQGAERVDAAAEAAIAGATLGELAAALYPAHPVASRITTPLIPQGVDDVIT